MLAFFLQHKIKIALFIVLLFGFFLRSYNSNWDQGFHMHPDERAITITTTQLQLPTSLDQFFSPESSWNPQFFAYGNFPFYLLKGVSDIVVLLLQDPLYGTYEKMNLVGRAISAFADTLTIFLVFLLGTRIKGRIVGLLAAFFYSISVLPIQTSHFYAVDILLTFFITLTLYFLLRFYESPATWKALCVGIAFGFALATKISAIVLIPAVAAAITLDFFLIFIKTPHKFSLWLPHLPPFLKKLFLDSFLIMIATIITTLFLQPYMIIDLQEFINQNILQSEMTHNAFIFPYTLQYVGKIPYLYELQNIFFWGLGPLLATLAFIGAIFFTLTLFSKTNKQLRSKEAILALFFWIYFVIVGNFAVGWIRYMLPVYPLLALFAATCLFTTLHRIKPPVVRYAALFIINISLLVWPASFMHIYTQTPTRVQATAWIHTNIPAGKTLAIEHWDDALPLYGQERYVMQTLPLYDPDTPEKWEMIDGILAPTDYIILASNRLSVPLQKLTDCQTLPPGKCYLQTASYYRSLFDETRGFTKVAEFSVLPKIPFTEISIDDQSADEAFTVYDHPKVIIFQRSL